MLVELKPNSPPEKSGTNSNPLWPSVIGISALMEARKISENPMVNKARYVLRKRKTSEPTNRPKIAPITSPMAMLAHTGGKTISVPAGSVWVLAMSRQDSSIVPTRRMFKMTSHQLPGSGTSVQSSEGAVVKRMNFPISPVVYPPIAMKAIWPKENWPAYPANKDQLEARIA